jgi:hypothetical protein|tara:strand:+ start:135 stop:854 length:720 start_codon:yes stop_codon:yes gene_type:complete
MKKINWKTISSENMPIAGEYLSISSAGITFNAEFVRNKKLLAKKAVKFFTDDGQYFFGFEFLDDKEPWSFTFRETNLKTTTATRTCNAGGLISQSKVLSNIKKEPLRRDRIFEIQEDATNPGMFYVELKPGFEFTTEFSNIKNVPNDVTGIYRCLDQEEKVVYIGSGLVKAESLAAQKKSGAQFKFVEYSPVADRDKAYKWERHYQEEYKKQFGVLPTFNKILAPQRSCEEQESNLRAL